MSKEQETKEFQVVQIIEASDDQPTSTASISRNDETHRKLKVLKCCFLLNNVVLYD